MNNSKNFLIDAGNVGISPWWLTGFVDGEGSFQISILENKKLKTGWVVSPKFQIALHEKDRALLELIRSSFGVGKIFKHGKNSIQYRVSLIKELEVIINQLDKYLLITQKRADYLLFKQVLELIKNKEHLTKEGLNKILAIKASMNKGLRDELKSAFPSIIPVARPLVVNQLIPDPNWVSGFASGEGCFYIKIGKSSLSKTGFQVLLNFKITQHLRDEQLLQSFIGFLGCGNYSRLNKDAGDFVVNRLSDLTNKIIPFFKKYPILGIKSKDFEDLKIVAELMSNKEHLTALGLEKIKQIKLGMNRERNW